MIVDANNCIVSMVEGETAMEGRETGPGLKSASELFKKLSKEYLPKHELFFCSRLLE